eukprot:CAMPEP_0198551440 /NCGR_PEP_ID=MMETSP1462-20131121/76706_1 /TAXON_ID=1333877 /ORGANISM="Brandtodinium nutriculum, Strain RCC3387" /LENGTH=81 /DNA_ID=CAMNT_0044282079 /DNA_START=83 /DNA_END=324 /DNA_ORIENTATION=-
MPPGNTQKSPALIVTSLQDANLPVGVIVASPSRIYASSVPDHCQSNFVTGDPQVPHLLMPLLDSASLLAISVTSISGSAMA